MDDIQDLVATDGPLKVEFIGAHILLVTLNRPAARNAINGAIACALERVVRAVNADPELRVAILTGAGDGVFCAGADLKEIAAGRVGTLKTADGGFAGFVNARRNKPWIAAVNGLALAGGCELMLACDLVIAAESAEFALPEVSRGLIALAGGCYRLVRALPRAVALEMILTGERLDAGRAYHHGLVNRLVRADAVCQEAIRVAEKICRNAPVAVQESLNIARQSHDLTDEQLIALGDSARARLIKTEDFREGPRAFIERREPRWTGR
ncbi:enoyl-CoA hydratase-related protein [Noviherbaspirillum sedimenti]|uniref:Enoyl-CoA hydratase n=1 Tax=Noviherbaspirillum sedimenti TaxID=2320865 RepID=A0A3A3G713_9BURK|nr:enoyl-CoA hydratase-related protein [Noviherbaspirillum sedimenti]RJG04208.1 enoyl-CoA hydratase [Noviherbaspirillum sedimenti]